MLAEVTTLAEQCGLMDLAWMSPVVWGALSNTQRLDCIATKLLSNDRKKLRDERQEEGTWIHVGGYLSPRQFEMRLKRETAVDPEAIAYLFANERVRKVPFP
jgi:hypothetical protein